MPYRNSRYNGKFDVSKISDSKRDVVVDGVTKTRAIKLYMLDQFTYSDSNKEVNNTEVLAVGDELMVNSAYKNTRYKVTYADNANKQVELELVEGFEPIKITADSLAIYKNVGNTLEAEINVGFNERMLVFIKAIDPVSKMLAEQWSPGVGFYSNDLNITKEGDQLKVEGTAPKGDEEVNYLHKGIGGRNFSREFTLADHVEVESAGLELGMLNIHLKRNVPEELQPKKIKINDGLLIDGKKGK